MLCKNTLRIPLRLGFFSRWDSELMKGKKASEKKPIFNHMKGGKNFACCKTMVVENFPWFFPQFPTENAKPPPTQNARIRN